MIQYFISIIILFAAYKYYTFGKCPKELEHIPKAPFWSFLRFTLSGGSYNDKMKQYFQPLLDKYGIIRVYGIEGWALFIGDAKIAKEISMKSDIFGKPNFATMAVNPNIWKFFGRSQVTINNGEEWKRHRKIINPIFNKSWSTELFGTCVLNLIEGWEKSDGQEVKVHDLIQRLTLDVLGKAIFDVDFKAVKDPDSHLFHLYNNIIHQLFENIPYLMFPFLEKMPYFKRPKLVNDLNEYDKFVENIMELRKKEMEDTKKQQSDNLITTLIQSNENTDETTLSLDEIRDNIKIFILAGHDTTSGTLTSTLYYLARYPEIQDKLRQEVLDALGHPNQVVIPTIEQLKSIPYMDLVNKESMRIMTTATAIQRAAHETHTLSNGIVVPKDTQVFLHLWGIHHHSSVFQNPEEFNPDRFKDLSSDQSRSWQPFTTGNRSCIGTTFSMMEQRVTIAMLLQKFEFSMTSGNPDYHNLRLTPIGIVHPKDLNISIKVRY